MKKLIYALRFMTNIPIPWKEGEDMGEVARSISFFPIVGFIIGIINFGLFSLLSIKFSPFFTSVVVVIWWIFITGGLHLDGMADTSDGVWGGTTKKRRLEIMKDSRTGVFGVLTLISFLLLKTASIYEAAEFHKEIISPLFICAPVLGRWISVFSIYFFNSARREGLGNFFKENIGIKELVITFVLTVIILFFSGGLIALGAMLIITVLSYFFSLFFRSKLGGLTGDVYGTLCETAEFLTILVFLLLW